MLPLSLLNAAQGRPMQVELKSGETLNGHLVNCDTWMNLTLKDVIQTSADGEQFLKIPETYVRGNIIKYLRVPDELIDQIKEDRQNRNDNRNFQRYGNRNQGGGRGGGSGGGYNRRGNNRGGGYRSNNNRNYNNNNNRDNNNNNNRY